MLQIEGVDFTGRGAHAQVVKPDRALDVFAARQYGTFSRSQAYDAGFTPRMIEHRIVSGAWLKVSPSVLALASAPPGWERQVAAAVLSMPGAVVAGTSAAYLHGFDGFGRSVPVVMVPQDHANHSSIARVIRSNHFSDVGRQRIRGFVVSNEAETIMTLARSLSESRLERLVDEVLARRSTSVADLIRVVDRSSGVPGIAKLRPLVRHRQVEAYQPPTSELERLLYSLLDHPSLPTYTRQAPIDLGATTALVDAYIPAWRLIVESDGRRWHTRRADYERDRQRDNLATASGFAVLRFTYEMIRNDPERCLETLRRTGETRRAG